MKSPIDDDQLMLESLKRAVANALERKRRLGQYAVVWEQGKLRRIGEDKPIGEQEPR